MRHSGYVLKSLNMNAYIGQTVQIRFFGKEDVSLATSFVIGRHHLDRAVGGSHSLRQPAGATQVWACRPPLSSARAAFAAARGVGRATWSEPRPALAQRPRVPEPRLALAPTAIEVAPAHACSSLPGVRRRGNPVSWTGRFVEGAAANDPAAPKRQEDGSYTAMSRWPPQRLTEIAQCGVLRGRDPAGPGA